MRCFYAPDTLIAACRFYCLLPLSLDTLPILPLIDDYAIAADAGATPFCCLPLMPRRFFYAAACCHALMRFFFRFRRQPFGYLRFFYFSLRYAALRHYALFCRSAI